MSDKVIAYCGTKNIYDIMETAAKSALANTEVDKIIFFIETDSFPYSLPSIIETRNVSDQHWFPSDGANYNSPWTYMAYIRLALAKILPDLDRILYLDTDTLVLRDISGLFNTDITGKLFCMIAEDIGEQPIEYINGFACFQDYIQVAKSQDPRPEYPVRPYYNSGVMLMNLEELRKTKMDDVIIHELNTVYHRYPDQDAINILCKDNIVPAPTEYNVIPALCSDFPKDKIRIKHFASDKPLWKSGLWQSYKRMSWDTVMNRQNKLKKVVTT